MRKSTKIAMLVAAIVLLASLTVFAKGWKQDDYGWYYEDAYGMMEYLKWEKSGDNYYYLGEDGYMATNALVLDSNGNKFWVGEDGAKVANVWVKVPADDYDQEAYGVDYRWYHFGATGKADVNKKITYNGNTYWFDADGKMLFGYINTTNKQMVNLDNPFDTEVEAYCGSNEDGAMVKDIWYKIDITGQEAYDEESFAWVYFKSTGAKAYDENTKSGLVWKNNRYFFDSLGKMKSSFKVVSISSENTVSAYLSGADDGHMTKKAWVYATNPKGDSEDGKHWYYYDAKGAGVPKDCVKKINNKYYAFTLEDNDYTKDGDPSARMAYGLVALTIPETKTAVADASDVKMIDASEINGQDWKADTSYADVWFFSNDEVNDGSLKKSITVDVEFFDDTYKITLDKNGKVANYKQSNGKYYQNGMMVAADPDVRYAIFEVQDKADATAQKKLINSSGVVFKSGVAVDADGNYYVVLSAKKGNYEPGIYTVSSYYDYAVRAAQAVNSGLDSFKADGETFTLHVDGNNVVTY